MTLKLINNGSVSKNAIAEILAELGIKISDTANITLTLSQGDTLSVSGDAQNINIAYKRKNELFRGLSYINQFVQDLKPINEASRYSMLCYMADNSRNAVYNIPSAKRMIRYLAMMGYDSMMLYTEDTYELPNYKYFGYMRGRFTEAELRELDDYAYMLGIELIPCVQTLAHLSTALKWPDFSGFKDSGDILMVGDERTYAFIKAILTQCKKCFRSDRINLGMDEAHAIGCGQYLKKNGYRKPSEIMLEHLNKVAQMCKEIGYRPMMWSDMFFRMQFGGIYRVREGEVDPEVCAKVPENVDLVYWDYYSVDSELFSHMLDCHAKFPCKTLFAGGAWKWYGFGTHNAFSLHSSKMQLDNCEAKGISDIIVTSWGDNGGAASQFSVMSTLLYFAERDYANECTDDQLNKRSLTLFKTAFSDLLSFDLPDTLPETVCEVTDSPKNPSTYLLFNDPLERFLDCHLNRETASDCFAENAKKLASLANNEVFGYALETLCRLCDVLSLKCDLGWRIYDAYTGKDKEMLLKIAKEDIPTIIEKLDAFYRAYKNQWYKENKTFGFITQEVRIGALKQRLTSVSERLYDYVNGDIQKIEELECPPLPFKPGKEGEYIALNNWKSNLAAGIM